MTTKATNTSLVPAKGIPLNGVDDLMRLADICFKAGICPAGVGRPEAAAAIILMGAEVGLSPVVSLQQIMIVNGKATLWGDAPLALVRRSGLLAAIDERIVEGDGDRRRAVCKVTRKGEPEREFEFSVGDARKAGLWDNPKKPIWKQYPERMLQARARTYALRDVFPDVLGGMVGTDELADDGPNVTVSPSAETPAAAHPSAPAPQVVAPAPQQLPAAASTPVAVEGELMSDAAQHAEIKKLQEKFMVHAYGVVQSRNPERFREEWLKCLAKWKVDSAVKLTHAQAEELLDLMRTDADKLVEKMRNFF